MLTKVLLVLIQTQPLKKLMLNRAHLKCAEKEKYHFSLNSGTGTLLALSVGRSQCWKVSVVLLKKLRLWYPL